MLAVAIDAWAAALAAWATPPVFVITFLYRMNNTLLQQFDRQVVTQTVAP
jgi:hypothetical protein